ncbi:Cytosine-specific methyltransferase, partial [Operophtera brumata]
MENDEVVSVAIGPPPIRAKYEKPRKKKPRNQPTTVPTTSLSAVGLMKDLLMELTREFLTKDNLTGNLRLSMQHEVLELIVKYQKLNRGDVKEEVEFTRPPVIQMLKDVIVDKK